MSRDREASASPPGSPHRPAWTLPILPLTLLAVAAVAALLAGQQVLPAWLAALALLLAAGLAFAAARLDWPVAVVAGGLGLLGGPLAWQGLQPLRLDRPAGLVLTILAAAAAAAAAHWL